MEKIKKVPQRKCIACQKRGDKNSLIRVVKNKEDEIFLDTTGKANGRGAYLCSEQVCLEKAIKSKALNRAFKTNVEDEIYTHLIDELKTLNSSEEK